MGDDSSQETQVPNGKRNHLLYRTVKNRAAFFVLNKRKKPHLSKVGFINRSNNIVNRSNDLFIVYIISVVSEAI